MIHHMSISASNPHHVAEVLAQIWNGKAVPFSPHPGSYMALSNDEYGTMIEVYPLETELIPGRDNQPANFQQNQSPSQYYPIHAAISVPINQARIEEIANQAGWRVLHCHRGQFDVMEFWVENRLMLELLTPEMAQQYLDFAQKRNLEQFTSSAV
ncbi:hypothetical protein [Richelia sinica]|nr:hypothetical protein [Richelia sinica]MBD2663705.1 hypothetical protein [Richelia sinica FACHB-800]